MSKMDTDAGFAAKMVAKVCVACGAHHVKNAIAFETRCLS